MIFLEWLVLRHWNLLVRQSKTIKQTIIHYIAVVFSSQGRWLRITVFLAVTSPYTAVYNEIRHENGPYLTVYDRIHAVFFDQGRSSKNLFRHLEKNKERYEWKKMWWETKMKCSWYTRWFLSFFVSFILDGISFKQSS
jgi:hypothetical protein